MSANFYELLYSRFKDGGDFIRNPDNQPVLTYGELHSRSGAYGNYLTAAGLHKGDRVMVQVDKSAECLVFYFACLRAGLIYLPLNTAYQQHEIAYFLSDADPALVICSPADQEMMETLTDAQIETLDNQGMGSLTAKCEGQPDEYETTTCDPDDTAVILYTSGTTGQPKGAEITHGNLAANGLALLKAWGWRPGDVMLHALPIFHIHGLFVAAHLPVLNASPIIYLPHFDAATVIKSMPKATVYMGVPTNYTRLLADPDLSASSCANMRLFTSGSAPLLEQTFQSFSQRTGFNIVERYGMTETGMNTSNPLLGPQKPGTVGPVLTGVEARVVNDNGELVQLNETGNLEVRGANVFKAYWRKPEKTAEEFTDDGYFRTGDLAAIDNDGYIAIVGRNKDMIISGGLNVYPKEIEAVIDDMDGVAESAVIGLPHADFGEAVTAVVVRVDSTSEPDEDQVITKVKATLANFKVPKQVHFVEELPRNTMGKVQKNILREKYSAT